MSEEIKETRNQGRREARANVSEDKKKLEMRGADEITRKMLLLSTPHAEKLTRAPTTKLITLFFKERRAI